MQLLLRHALPLRAQAPVGGADPELAPSGLLQAEAVGAFLEGESVHAVVSSPMVRAKQTADPLATRRGLPVVIEDDLAEYDSGQPSYVPVHELRESDPALWQQMMRGELPGHVDLPAFRGLVVGALERVAERNSGRRTVAVFCHAGVINAALGAYLGIARAPPLRHRLLQREPDRCGPVGATSRPERQRDRARPGGAGRNRLTPGWAALARRPRAAPRPGPRTPAAPGAGRSPAR